MQFWENFQISFNYVTTVSFLEVSFIDLSKVTRVERKHNVVGTGIIHNHSPVGLICWHLLSTVCVHSSVISIEKTRENHWRLFPYSVLSYIILLSVLVAQTFLSSCWDSAWFMITSKNTMTLLKMLFIWLKTW